MTFRKYDPIFNMSTTEPRRVISIDTLTGSLILEIHGKTLHGLNGLGARMTPEEAHELALALLHYEERARRIASCLHAQEAERDAP